METNKEEEFMGEPSNEIDSVEGRGKVEIQLKRIRDVFMK